MSERQWKRLDVVERVNRGQLTSTEAAAVLNLSVRQLRRVRRAVEQRGRAGVIHGNRGRPARHRVPEEVRARGQAAWTPTQPACKNSYFLDTYSKRLKDRSRTWMIGCPICSTQEQRGCTVAFSVSTPAISEANPTSFAPLPVRRLEVTGAVRSDSNPGTCQRSCVRGCQCSGCREWCASAKMTIPC